MCIGKRVNAVHGETKRFGLKKDRRRCSCRLVCRAHVCVCECACFFGYKHIENDDQESQQSTRMPINALASTHQPQRCLRCIMPVKPASSTKTKHHRHNSKSKTVNCIQRNQERVLQAHHHKLDQSLCVNGDRVRIDGKGLDRAQHVSTARTCISCPVPAVLMLPGVLPVQ